MQETILSKMIDGQKRLGSKHLPDLVKTEICGISEIKSPTKE